MLAKADLHIHTLWSDGKLNMVEVIDYYAECGFNIIAITDHGRKNQVDSSTFPTYLKRIHELIPYAQDKGIHLIPGIEVSAPKYHLVVLWVKAWIDPRLTVGQAVDRVREQGAFCFIAHPGPIKNKPEKHQAYTDVYDREKEFYQQFDAVEIINGNQFFADAVRHNCPHVANTDFHIKGNMRSWKNMLDLDRIDRESIEKAIRSRKNYLWRYVGRDIVVP